MRNSITKKRAGSLLLGFVLLISPLLVHGDEIVYSQGFEADNGSYAAAGTAQWAWGTPTGVGPSSAHSGLYCWGDEPLGEYSSHGQRQPYISGDRPTGSGGQRNGPCQFLALFLSVHDAGPGRIPDLLGRDELDIGPEILRADVRRLAEVRVRRDPLRRREPVRSIRRQQSLFGRRRDAGALRR